MRDSELRGIILDNTFWIDSKARAAAPRDGGQIVDNIVVPANVKTEGTGPSITSIAAGR